jgi:hypothetical protein
MTTDKEPTMKIARSKDEWLAGSAGGTNMTGELSRRTRSPLGVAAAGALLAVLVPKCPMCLAMYLSFLGAAASWFVWLRPLGVVLTVAGVAVAGWRWIDRRTT